MRDIEALRRAFDRDMRRALPARFGVRIEVEPRIRRTFGLGGAGWFSVDWSDLDDQSADAAIAAEAERFASMGVEFEWKYFDYDRPADLERRLLAAGFVAGDDEAVMVGEIAAMPAFPPPKGVRIAEVGDEEGVDRLVAVHDAAFGRPDERYREMLLDQLRADSGETVMVLALAGDVAVSGARLEMIPGVSFASLWGGGTVPEWRGRGLYRALVSYRAAIAAARGYRYLHVDALPDSRPILERLGFVCIARTTPYVRRPR